MSWCSSGAEKRSVVLFLSGREEVTILGDCSCFCLILIVK